MGRKLDNDKNRLDLVIPSFIIGLGEVLTYGAKKYKSNNWQTLNDPVNRYYGAATRHLLAWRNGEAKDPESGIHHLLHAACNLMFLLWFENRKEETDEQKSELL